MKYKYWVTLDNVVLGLLFLFPIAGTFVRHWISDIYVLLFLLAVYFVIRRDRQVLCKEEVIWLWLLVAYFLIFIFTAVVNGWTERQTDWVLLELRFIGIIPVYLMLRQYPEAGRVLLYGIALGLCANIIWGFYEIYLQTNKTDSRLTGAYSPLFIGPVIILMCALLIPATQLIERLRKNRLWVMLAILLGIYLTIESQSRNAYLAFLVLAILIPLYYHQGKNVIVSIVFISICVITLYNYSSTLQQRVIIAGQEFTSYLNEEDKVHANIEASPVGIRLEMWRAAQYVLKDSLFFGIGRGNYSLVMEKYVNDGLVNPTIADRAHPHNAFIETFVSRGLLGLTIMLLLMYYPLYIFIRTRHNSPHTALLGIVHITAISIFSLTETAAFVKGNFVAVNLLFLAVFFSWHLRQVGYIKVTHSP